jgi:DUF1680 family protein
MIDAKMPRRDFLVAALGATASVAAAALADGAPAADQGAAANAAPTSKPANLIRLETFDYRGVRLRDSRWQKQQQAARDFYFGVADDDILHGYRQAAGLPAPGKALGGWCAPNSNTVFGQWLQGMTRLAHATDDHDLRNKAIGLAREWSKTIGGDGDCRMRHYPFEKLVGGLVDLKQYAGFDDAIPLLEKVTAWASKNLDRTRDPAAPRPADDHSGRPLEWYTLGENLYRAFQLTGDAAYKSFGDVWQYHAYWDKFANTPDPSDAWGVHAYSHVNTFSSCAMAYAVSGDSQYLQIIKNAYDFLQNTQCYATGGYGPVERIMPSNGNLGKALEIQSNSCEAPCCSWAGFKLAKYLMQSTGEARYGDWIERLLYNAIGAALPITGNGKNFYYADYRVAGGLKYYARSTYTCCSGTYFQATAEYSNLIYFHDASGLYVNLYVPSDVSWDHGGDEIKLVQETSYPEAETSTFTISMNQDARFALRFRIPSWASGVSLKVNGSAVDVDCKAGTWATIDRPWHNGDRVEIRIPLPLRLQAVDRWHPHRVAVVRGPVVLVQDASVHEAVYGPPGNDEDLNKLLVPDDRTPGVFHVHRTDGVNVGATFQPFYAVAEVNTYRMYFDLDALPIVLW